MARFKVYYAMLITARRGEAARTRYFMGYNRQAVRKAMLREASAACDIATGIWSIHDHLGAAVEAHTFSIYASSRWWAVPKDTLHNYDMNSNAFHMMIGRLGTVNADGTVTEDFKKA